MLKEDMTIRELVAEADACSREKGWHDEPVTPGELVALIHSEVSEILEDIRRGAGMASVSIDHVDRPMRDASGVLVRDGGSNPVYEHGEKPHGVPIELADVVIRCCEFAARYGVDLAAAIRQKAAYNRTRPYRHGGKRL